MACKKGSKKLRSLRNQEVNVLNRNQRIIINNIREEELDKEQVFHAPIFLEQERKKVVTFSGKIVHFTHIICGSGLIVSPSS